MQFKTDMIGAESLAHLNFHGRSTPMVRPATISRAWLRRASQCSAAPDIPGVYQSVGLAAAADGVFVDGSGIDTVKTWGLRGAYNHNWDPFWNSALYGAYAQLQYGDAGKGLICAWR